MPGQIFPGHPQKYPKAMARAGQLASRLHTMMQRASRSLVATVTGTSFHVSQGYVSCTTEQGLIRVYGVPYGTVVPQMRIYARVQGGSATNRAYVFDGYAPSLSSLSQSGSILFYAPSHFSGAMATTSTTSSVATTSSLTTSVGYYWHLFFYLPQLPANTATILSMWTGSVSTAISLEILGTGTLRLRSVSDSHELVTEFAVAPHLVHWVQIQPGYTGNELLVDSVSNYGTDGSIPTFAGGGATYTLTVLSDASGNNPCPLGSWVSKVGFGMSYASGAVVPLPNVIPASDAQVPSFNVSSTQTTTALYLANESEGSLSAANSAPAGSASGLSLPSGLVKVHTLGPY